ncbi:ChlADR2 NADPH-dependent aldehyde reductase 2 [Candida maltosa Xu316]|uniref:Short chain dehydrogenase n=1 Tax=Candida maltosa (strain Xu316) TaxID=1245528 RepID=M3J5A7_CANMX|nr:hypothetical protein G210_2461 [Candida maltosa Xu316]
MSLLAGKTSIVTGGTKNLGATSAKELAKAGSNLFLHYRSDPETADKFKAELLKEFPGIRVETYQAKLDRAEDLTKLFEAAKKAFPEGIDIAVNFVGKVVKKPITEVTEAEFDAMDIANNKSAFFFIKEAGLNLKDNGRIVSIVTSLLPAYTEYYGLYQGTKGAVEYYTKAASKELHSRGITVNNVGPGPASSSFLFNSETKESIEFFKTVGLHNRLTLDTDIAPIVRFLVTEGGWITGQTIYASGGFTAR